MQKNAIFSKTKQFRAILVSIDNLQKVAHRFFKEPIIGPLKSAILDLDVKMQKRDFLKN